MSDDASPSSAARIHDPTRLNADENGAASEDAPDNGSSSRRQSGSRSQRRRKKKSKRLRNPGLTKKLEFLTHLLNSLDTLVFLELSALYYMECSMLRFILRAFGQYIYLTPKHETFPFFTPAVRMHTVLIISTNIICILLHLFGSLPVGPEYHRGYMHGGVIIDFVGQKPPGSRLYYLLADIAILGIQCLMLTIHTERENLRCQLKLVRPLLREVIQEVTLAPRTIEDLDAEERGISRELSGVTAANETEDIELRPLRGEAGEDSNERTGESGLRRESSNDEEPSRSHLSDLLISGNGVLGEYHVIHAIRAAAIDVENSAANSIRSLSYGATIAAIEARRHGSNIAARRAGPVRQR